MKKKFYQKKWFIVLMVILAIGIIGGALGGNETPPEPENNSTTEQPAITEPTETEEPTQPRENSIGTSNKDVAELENKLIPLDVPNDVTKNWKYVTIAQSTDFTEYALSYYNTYFSDNKEIHAIINFTNNTTTKISVIGNMLDVTIYEYVDKEEHDAKKLFSGMLLTEYFVYIDNGDIEEVQ